MKNKSGLVFIQEEVYRAHFWFCWGNIENKKILLRKILAEDPTEFLDHLKTVNGTHYLYENDDGSRLVIIWVRDPRKLETLTHELSHFCFNKFISLGIPMTIDNDEPLAYYMESITRKCLEAINKPKNARTNLPKTQKKDEIL